MRPVFFRAAGHLRPKKGGYGGRGPILAFFFWPFHRLRPAVSAQAEVPQNGAAGIQREGGQLGKALGAHVRHQA